MSGSATGRVVRTLALLAAGASVHLLATAPPAAAHDVGTGALPAPTWLLGYLGAFAVLATAAILRATWPHPRLQRFRPPPEPATSSPEAGGSLGATPGRLVGLGLLLLALVAAIVGPDSGAANIAPVAVLVVWWVGLPIVCLVAGDAMRAVNPFLALTALVDRRPAERAGRSAPTWTSAAFLGAFAWFFIAYHRPGSPRALAVFLVAYSAAAVAGGVRWGRAWLATGEGFGALSAGIALLAPWRRRRTGPPPGLAALLVVWLGSTVFDAFTNTTFWVDVLGTSQGWSRTLLNTVGMVWLTAIVAGAYLAALRVAERLAARHDEDLPPLPGPLGVALLPLAVGWFLAHDLTLLLFEGQNFLALLSDPIGRGWDLVGTVGNTIDYGIVQSAWVGWAQTSLLLAGHVGAVVVAHDVALWLARRRPALRVTWAVAVAAVASIVTAVQLVLG